MFLNNHQEQLRHSSRLKPVSNRKENFLNLHSGNHHLAQLDAVIIRNLIYEAGTGRAKRTILNKINLTVPEGSIYGLLGPSGCGKTTMLRCVVGRIRPPSGAVLVFGFRPGEGHSGVPGRDVGYMPQEISIYEDFTIEETLEYFGKINRMHTSDIKKRIQFLLKFLDLPSRKRLVMNLSGGQKRRVSLAAALVHSPPLLILDEPTVGVDPLLRQSIWKHLVTLTQTERISVIITTHYIEEARQANVVGLMRHGKILAEESPDELMRSHSLTNLEDVFLKLCVTDSSRRAASLASGPDLSQDRRTPSSSEEFFSNYEREVTRRASSRVLEGGLEYSHRWKSLGKRASSRNKSQSAAQKGANINTKKSIVQLEANVYTRRLQTSSNSDQSITQPQKRPKQTTMTTINVPNSTAAISGLNRSQLNEVVAVYSNEAVENFSSEEEPSEVESAETDRVRRGGGEDVQSRGVKRTGFQEPDSEEQSSMSSLPEHHVDEYLTMQALNWATRRNNSLSLINLKLARNLVGVGRHARDHSSGGQLWQWWKTLMAVTWKNYIRLRRNPPVLIFQFMLPAIQVILFCLCIGGEPFDVPVAIVNDETVPRSSLQFLNGLDRKIIRQIKYDNLTNALEAVKRGKVWGAIHIPDKYSQNLQSRLIMGEEVNNETISNGTIRVYPDLTNLHLALALETTFRETFINFARDSLEEMGYDRSLADLPIQVGKPVYGTMRKDGYLEFMAPGVVISISYVMATGLTALAFILERRDGLLERSLVSGVQTSQILLAHAINQVVVMTLQIFLVLACTFFIFEIPSRGPFFWVVLLILLQGCTGMGFGLLVSAICKEENTAVMMVVGTFYTNLILAGIIWPIEAMPHWLRPVSYAQPQTLPTDTLRHILSRGWGITETGVLIGFGVTIGWLVIFLMAAGVIFKYSR